MNASLENDKEPKVSPSTQRSPPIQQASSSSPRAAAVAVATAHEEEEQGPLFGSRTTDDLDASRHHRTAIDLDIPTSAVEMKDGDDITKTLASPKTRRIIVGSMMSTSPNTSSSPATEGPEEATTVDAATSSNTSSIPVTAPENAPTKKRRRSATKPKSTTASSSTSTPTKPAKKRVRNTLAAATADDSSTAAMSSLKPAPVVVAKSPPPLPWKSPETFYPHLAAPQPASLLEFTTIAQRRQARKDQLAKAAADDPPFVPTEICGIPVPFQRYDACAECGTIDGNGDPNNKIILCDGP